MKKTKKTAKSYTGFSLIETLVSVFLITVGLLATVALISKSMMESMDSRNQLIAGELAQEGIEVVRNIRDDNWANGVGGFDVGNFIANDSCRVGKNSTTIVCPAPSYAFNIGNSGLNNGFYYYGVGTATKFQRRIIIADVGLNKKITSVVTWNNSAPTTNMINCNIANKCTYVEVTLTDWGNTN